jgi:hypothetical protein
VVTDSGAATFSVIDFEAVRAGDAASSTFSVNTNVPDAVGVPEIAPVLAVSVTPAGSAPDVIDHVYGVVPPVATAVVAYAVPVTPVGSVADVVMLIGAAMPIEKPFTTECAEPSEHRTPNANEPVADGVPEITPVLGASESPPGSAPESIVQV